MLLPQPVWLTPDTLDFYAARQGLTLSAGLRPEPIWRDDDEKRAREAQAHAELDEQGLLDRGAPSVELVIALRALCAGDEGCQARIGTASETVRLVAGAQGTDMVVAEYTEGKDKVQLRDVKADTIVAEIVAGLPAVPPARDQTITCRVGELTAPSAGIATERIYTREAKRLRALHERDKRLRETKLVVSVRDRDGRRGNNRDRAPVVLDVEPGHRWLTYLSGAGEDVYLNARPADSSTIIEVLDRELSGLRAAVTA